MASSKSASQTLAPEFSALIVILRSVGPVISTRRSTRPGAGGATCQSPSRIVLRLREEVQRAAGGELGVAVLAGPEQLQPPAVEGPVELGEELEGARR